MKRLNWWTTIVLLLISQAYAASLNEAKTQESDLKSDAKELIKAAASSAEYSASLANDYQSEKQQQQQDNIASSSSSVSTSADSNSNYNNNLPSENQQYSQPLSYSQPGTPIQPIHSYSQPLSYAPSGYTSESQQITTQYGADSNSQYPSLKDVSQPEIPSASASSQYYPQYPAHQQYNPHLVLQSQASAPISDYHQSSNSPQQQQSYDSNQATYVQPAQHQNVYLHHQHHVAIPGSSYSEQSYVVDNGDKNAYSQQPSSYSQPLPPEYSAEYSHSGNNVPPPPPPAAPSNVQIKPKKTVILAIPVKLVAKNKYSGQNNNGYSAQPEIPQPHYSTNVVPAAANVPVSHSYEKSNDYEKPSFNEKPLYADKPAYTDKSEEYPKVNHNLNNNLNNNGYNGEYESDQNGGDQYPRNNEHGQRGYNSGPHKPSGPMYNQAREVKPLSNYQTNRRRPNYGPEMYGNGGNTVTEYSSGPAHVEEEISVGQEHGNYPSVGEIEHNHIHALPHHSIPHHKHHKLNEIYEPVEHVPPYIPDFASLGGPMGSMGGISSYPNPMELIYSSPYKLSGPPHPSYGKPPSSGYGARPSLLSSASSQSSTSTSSNYGQFLSSLLSAYSLGGLKPASKPSSSSGKGGLASYLNNLPGFDLLKGYSALSSPSSYTNSLLTSASGLNKYYLPNPKQASKPNPYLGFGLPAEYAPQQQAPKPKPSGLLASSSNIVSSIDELFKSSLTSSNKFKRPAYSDVTRSITNLYKKLLN